MSRDINKKEQAQHLLRAMSDIDDRFLLEATAAEDPAAAGTAETKSAGLGKADKIISEKEDVPHLPAAAGEKVHSRRFRRYSTWALSAAACLAVIIVGRYVSVSSIRNEAGKSVMMSEAAKDAEETKDRAAGAAEEAEDAAGAAEEAEDAAGAAEEAEDAAGAAEEAEDAAGAAAEAEAAPEAAGEAEAVNSVTAKAGAGNALTMANPFIDTKTLEEAEEIAGFTIRLPEAEKPYDTLIYRAIEGEMLEIIYLDEAGREGYRIRKGNIIEEAGESAQSDISEEAGESAQSDISGGYNEYPAEEEIEADGQSIRVRGEKENEWRTAVWTKDGGGSFAIMGDSKTFTTGEIQKMAAELMA